MAKVYFSSVYFDDFRNQYENQQQSYKYKPTTATQVLKEIVNSKTKKLKMY